MRGVVSEALASFKVVWGNPSTEGYLRLIKEQIALQNPVLTNRNIVVRVSQHIVVTPQEYPGMDRFFLIDGQIWYSYVLN